MSHPALAAVATLIAGLLSVGCGGDDDGGAGSDAGPTLPPAALDTPVPARYEGTALRLTHGVGTNLGSTVLGDDAMGPFAVVLASQPISCATDLAATPPEGLYAILYVDYAVGTYAPFTVTMIQQTSGPRTSKTFDGTTADVVFIHDGRIEMTADAMLDDGAISSLFGGFSVVDCTS